MMASISPTTLQCSGEPYTGKGGYLKLTITSISDSDASTNQRYVGWKITVEGTPWVSLKARYATLGGHVIRPLTTTAVNSWTSGQQLDSGNETYSNDSSGNLTLYAYLKQLFYYNYSDTRWNNGTAQAADTNMVCSQLPRYPNFTSHNASPKINQVVISWGADVTCNWVRYYKDGSSSHTDVSGADASSGSFTVGGFSPGTSHTIKTEIRRKDSGLWRDNTVSFTMANLPTSNTPSNFNLGSSPTASIDSMSNLSHWYVDVYDGSTRIAQSGNITSTSKVINLTNATLINQMLARHPNDNYWNITFKYYCVSNGVTYTLTERTCRCTIPDGQYVPTFNENNVSYEVTDQQSLNITGSNKKVIKGISDILITLTPASPNGSATMKSYNATSGNSTGSTTNTSSPTISLTNVGANSVTVQAVDSRNRTINTNKAYSTFIDYFSPTISSSAANRIDGVGTNLNVNITGKYCNWSGLSTTNIIEQVSIQYKLKGTSQYNTISGVNLTITNNNGNFTVTGIITGNLFNAANEYDLLITLKDKLNNLTCLYSIPTGKALLWRDMLNNRIGINKKPTEALDVDGNIKCNNLKLPNYVCEANSGNVANYPWHRIATFTVGTGQYVDGDCILELRQRFNGGNYGRIKVSVRTNNSGAATNASVKWIYRSGYAVNSIAVGLWGTTGQNVYIDVYLQCASWARTFITQVDNTRTFTLVNSTEVSDTTASDKKGSVECYKNVTTAATELRGKAYTSISYSYDNSLLDAYPIGSIYISAVPTDPKNIFGGTWQQLKNHFLFATNATSGNKGKDAVGTATGTSTTQNNNNTGSTTLTLNQIPSHRHLVSSHAHTYASGSSPKFRAMSSAGSSAWDYTENSFSDYQGGGQGHTHTLGNHAHTVPYIEVYVWQRTG